MSTPSKTRKIARSALLSIWGLITLILVFTVSLLMYEMYQQGQSPIAISLGPTTSSTKEPAKSIAPQLASHEVQVFFASRTGTALQTETHRLSLSETTVENCRAALALLIDGPDLPKLAPVMSNKTRIRGMYLLENGELVIDFSRELEAGHIKSASAEMLMVNAIANTLCQSVLKGSNDLAVRSVRFLFEGSPYQHTFPAHIDLSEPVVPKGVTVSGTSLGNG